jgi:hypothetical protein
MNQTNSTEPQSPTDSAFVVYSAAALLPFTTIWLFANIVLVIARRNYQPLKARSVPAILLFLVICWVVLVVNSARLVVGRSKFPCLVYTASFCLMAPMIFIPHIIRCYKLLFVFKLSNLKVKYRTDAGEDLVSATNKKIKIMSRFISWPFIAGCALTLFLIQVAIWLLVSGLLSISQPVYFSFSSGCGLGGTSYVVLAVSAIYCVVDLIFIALLIRGVRDTWFIRYEIFVVSSMWLVLMIGFGVMFFVPIYADVYDYQFPAGYVCYFGLFMESFLSSFVPSILTFRKKPNTAEEPLEEAEKVLVNNNYRESLKEYAVMSFCTESICKLLKDQY